LAAPFAPPYAPFLPPFGLPFPFGYPSAVEMALLSAPLYGVPPTFYPFIYDPGRAPFLPQF